MKRSSARKGSKRRKAARDPQVQEFERHDLGSDIRRSGTARILRAPSKPTSILLDEALIEKLREKGKKRGLGYQTMLKVIVREHVDDY